MSRQDIYFTKPYLTHLREVFLRRNNIAERHLQKSMQTRREFDNLLYSRQHIRARSIVDLFFHACDLVVEIDESYHKKPREQDLQKYRERNLIDNGCFVLRFTSEEVMDNVDSVMDRILSRINELKKTRWKKFSPTSFKQLLQDKERCLL